MGGASELVSFRNLNVILKAIDESLQESQQGDDAMKLTF